MKDLIVIGIDAEWVYDPQTGNNKVISYQYAGRTTKGTWSGIIYTNSSRSGDRRRFVDVVGAALEHGRRDKQIPRKWPTNVTVAAHFTRADLSAFKDFANIRKFFDGVGGTFATLTYPYKVNFYDKSRNKHELSIRLVDTKLLTPGGKGLSSLGEMYEFPKLSLPEGMIEKMDELLKENRELFEAYAIRDAEISCLHAWKMAEFARDELGVEKAPSTLGSLSVKHLEALWAVQEIEKSEVLGTEEHVETRFNPLTGRMLTKKSQVYISAIHDQEAFATECFHGGRNEGYLFGFSELDVWNDVDLSGAYTTAMSAIRIPDYAFLRVTTDLNAFEAEELGLARIQLSTPE